MMENRDLSILTQVVYKQVRKEEPLTKEEWDGVVDEAVKLSVAIAKAQAKHKEVFKGVNM